MKPVILVDIDGTIALRGDRSPHDHDQAMEDAVNWPIVRLCDALYMSGVYDIVVMSGRDDKYRDITEYWLDQAHGILPYRLELLMRPRGDNRADEIVKWEMFYSSHYARYTWLVLDDRNKVVAMWRANGLTCLQVADGNF